VSCLRRNSFPKSTESANAAKKENGSGNKKWNITINYVQFENEIERENSYYLWIDSCFQIKEAEDK